jgi:hypothetical protein
MTEVLVERIRLRGAGTARLARIAARALPVALDRVLADLADGEVADVLVTLDPGVLGLDDDAIAVVWADAIRAALIAEGIPTGRRADAVDRPRRSASAGGERSRRASETVRRHARSWAESASPRGPVPAGALRWAAHASSPGSQEGIDDPRDVEVSRRVRAALMAELRIRGLRVDAQGRDGAATAASAPAPAAGPPPATSGTPGFGAAPRLPASADAAATTDAGAHGALAGMVEALAALVAGRHGEEPVDLDQLTRAAGLALLYPWLADHCRGAVEAVPLEPAVAVRAVALAALVDADDPALLDDPLVRHLAGVREGDPAVPPPRYDTSEVRDAADGVLRSFAALLPGFAGSSAAFVRREWIERPGLLESDRDPALLLASGRPLDVVLGALPYPLGLFALPWCGPVTVRFRS